MKSSLMQMNTYWHDSVVCYWRKKKKKKKIFWLTDWLTDGGGTQLSG